MEVDKQPGLDDWTDFAGEWIKAEYVKEVPAKLVCIGVDTLVDGTRTRLIAKVEYLDRAWSFDLNKTNQNFIKSAGLMPKDITGKVFVVEKVQVRNPQTAQMVDSLVITKIEQ